MRQPPDPAASASPPAVQPLTERCVDWVTRRIEGQVFKPGARLPSIRAMAKAQEVSPFTAVQAYDRLCASGLIQARAGSGFYVSPRREPARAPQVSSQIDLAWLTRHMLDSGRARGPGLGVLPAAWLDGAQIGAGVRSLGREGVGRWVASGDARGFTPLREVLQHRLAGFGVIARTDQIVLTTGIAQALDLVVRALVQPGEAVLVLDPCWFGALGMLAARGARVLGAPCRPDGLDLEALERLAREARPRLMIVSATAQNPTGLTFSPDTVRAVLEIAARHDITVFEDDVYADLGDPAAVRFAALDQLDRVVYAGSFSKTLAPNIRVGFLAARSDLAQSLTDAKVLTGFTTPELNERLIHKLLADGRYPRHIAHLRARLHERRRQTADLLQREGLEIFGSPQSGMFFWVDMRCDTTELAALAGERGLLLAPGALFSVDQRPSRWMRFNVTTPQDDALTALLAAARDLAL